MKKSLFPTLDLYLRAPTPYITLTPFKITVEVTLFFDENNLQVAIGFALTIMLVIYTMFQGVNYSLPQTAYLKFIDYWLIFCLIVPFTIFLIEVGWELDHARKLRSISATIRNKNEQ